MIYMTGYDVMHIIEADTHDMIIRINIVLHKNIVLCRVAAWDGFLVAACISSTLQEYNSNRYTISDSYIPYKKKYWQI